jgi:thymidylate synthase (FAD)
MGSTIPLQSSGSQPACIVASPARTAQGTPYFRSPGVCLLAAPTLFPTALVPFLQTYPSHLSFGTYVDEPPMASDGEHLCKVAGQLCYMSFGKGHTPHRETSAYVGRLLQARHGSVLEHATYSFLCYGISRSLTHELVRHRHCSFSQVSQRYVSSTVLRFVERPEYQTNEEWHRAFEERIDHVAVHYRELVRHLTDEQRESYREQGRASSHQRKRIQQVARSILPNEVEAPLVISAKFHGTAPS